MRTAFEVCQPSGYLGEEESALAQCFMAIAGFVRKMSGTSDVDADTMNRAVSKMVEGLGITDEAGWVITDDHMKTAIPGIFAIGDVRKKELRQITTAVGDGAIAGQGVYQYIENMK